MSWSNSPRHSLIKLPAVADTRILARVGLGLGPTCVAAPWAVLYEVMLQDLEDLAQAGLRLRKPSGDFHWRRSGRATCSRRRKRRWAASDKPVFGLLFSAIAAAAQATGWCS